MNQLMLSRLVRIFADIRLLSLSRSFQRLVQKKRENGWVVLNLFFILVFFTLLEARYRSETLLTQTALMPPSSK